MRFAFRLGTSLLLGSTLFGAPCTTGSLESYITGGISCTVGTVEFSNFVSELGLSGGAPIDPANVLITPAGTPLEPLLLLSLNQAATASELLELIFRVQASGLLTASSVSLGNAAVTQDGAVTGIVDVCADGIFIGPGPAGCSGLTGSALAFAIAGMSDASPPATFATSSFFDIFFDVTLDGGLGGSARLASATLGVTATEAVPEPQAILLVSIGLMAMGIRSHRQRRRHQPKESKVNC